MSINSPLFTEAGRQIKAIAQRQFNQSEFGKIVRTVSRYSKMFAPDPHVHRAVRMASSAARPERLIEELMGAELGGLVRTVERYSLGSSSEKEAVKQVLEAMGEPGKLISALVNPSQRNLMGKNLQEAMNLIRAYGGEVLPHKDWGTLQDLERGLRAAQAKLSEYGFGIPETQGPPRRLPQPEEGRTTVDTEVAANRYKRVPADHPMLTGEMVSTPESTNVYEFGYDIDTLTLYVRYQTEHQKGTRGGPGSLYGYYGVSPEEFLALYATRNRGGGEGGDSTPGTWIWSHVRERGTVSGHQKDYRLVGVMGGYVPRKATVRATAEIMGKRGKPLKKKGLEEWFVQRTVKTHEGRFARSVLPTQRVSKVRGGRG